MLQVGPVGAVCNTWTVVAQDALPICASIAFDPVELKVQFATHEPIFPPSHVAFAMLAPQVIGTMGLAEVELRL
jgi:hypothetical protein